MSGTDRDILQRQVAIDSRRLKLEEEQTKRNERKDKRERIATCLVPIGVAGIIASLLAVFVSLLNLRQQTENSVNQQKTAFDHEQQARYQSLTDRQIDLDKLLVDHPTLVPYFTDGVPLAPETDRSADSMAVALVDFAEYIYYQNTYLGFVPRSGDFVLRATAGPGHDTNDPWLPWSEYVK